MQLKNARVTLLFQDGGLHLEVEDRNSGIEFLRIHMNQEQTCKALSRLAGCKVESCEVYGLDKVGKIEQYKSFEFPFKHSKFLNLESQIEAASKEVEKYLPSGWTADKYFGSQNSFILKKNGTEWARTTIRRWVDKEIENSEDYSEYSSVDWK